VITDEQGRFTFLPVSERFRLGAVQPSLGYGEIEDADFQQSKKLIVQPWGRIEGTMQIGAQPLAGVEISLLEDAQIAGQARIGKSQRATTDSAGHFRFEKVAPGKKQLRRLRGNRFAESSYADVLPGGTTKVRIVGTGTP